MLQHASAIAKTRPAKPAQMETPNFNAESLSEEYLIFYSTLHSRRKPIGANLSSPPTVFLLVIPAKAGTHGATSAFGSMGSRFRGNDEYQGFVPERFYLSAYGRSPEGRLLD